MLKENYMKMAISLAEGVFGQTSPNPPVGSIVVKDGEIIGIGAHLKSGQKHAERIALEAAGDNAINSEVYVTLEPCAHEGKTPPCADFLIEKGVKKVYIATMDPNPLVSGKGIEKLLNSGIEVEIGVCKQEADFLYRPFFHYIQTKMPFVTLKNAMTVDGKIASYLNDSKWISSEESRADVHNLRHLNDAILVGVNTITYDDPQLNTRLPEGGKNPIRVVLDTHLNIPMDAKVLSQDASTIIFCGKNSSNRKELELKSKGIEIVKLQSDSISIKEVLMELGKKGIMTLLVEGGSEINGSFFKDKLFQKLIIYIAPKLIGGKNAPTIIGGDGFGFMKDAVELIFEKTESLGIDLKITATVKNKN